MTRFGSEKDQNIIVSPEEYAFSRLLSYVRYQWPDYLIGKHHAYIAKCLQMVEEGKLDRLIITMPPRMGKCSHVDTLVHMGDGSLRRAGDIGQGDVVLSYDDGNLCREVVLGVEPTRKKSIELKSRTGRKVIVSHDHPMLTYGGYKKTEDITLHDFLVTVHSEMPFEYEINDNELIFVACMIFEGSCHQPGKRFTNANFIVNNIFQNACTNLGFNVSNNQEVDPYQYSVNSRCHELLTRYGINHHLCYTKRLPKEFFKMSLRQKWMFVDLMFQTNGYYCLKAGNCGISLANEGLINDIQTLLSMCGIVSAKSYKKNNCAGAWVLTVGRSQVQKILDRCNLGGKRKKFEKLTTKRSYSNLGAFPNDIGRKLKCTFKNGFNVFNHTDISPERMKQMAEVYPELQKYLDMDFIYDKVTGIQNVGVQDLVHLQVSRTENYIANGFVSHNTLLASEYFSSWYLGRNPSKQIIFTTYSHDRAGDIGRKVRNQLQDPLFQQVFPGCRISKDTQSISNVGTDAGGNFFAVGLGGAITGRGAHCVSGETLVKTENGDIPIADLYSMEKLPKVLAFNEKTGKIELKNILATRRTLTHELFTIRTCYGHKIKCTGEHRIYDIESGYRETSLFKPGDRVAIYQEPKKQTLRCMRKGESRKKSFLQRVLFQNKKNDDPLKVREVWQNIRTAPLRIRKGVEDGAQRFLLFPGMFDKRPRDKKQEKVRDLRQTGSKENNEILFSGMPKEGCEEKKPTAGQGLPSMLSRILSKIKQTNVLFEKLCQSCSFRSHDGNWEFTLYGWPKLFSGIQKTEKNHNQERRETLCSVQCLGKEKHCEGQGWKKETTENKPDYSPCRRRPYQQLSSQSDNDVFEVPLHTSQVKPDAVSHIERDGGGAYFVYDIQVEDHENFFANDILVHNCLLIDDPIKGQEEANSSLFRSKMQDWYQSTAYTRLMPGKSAVIIILTRWGVDDLAGWLIKEHAEENWFVLNLPAIAVGNKDPIGRQPGEALWPEMYPLERLLRIKRAVGTQVWNALYQGNPVGQEGTIVKYQWFQRYDEVPEKLVRVVQSWDTAFKPKQLNDPSVCITFGETKNGFYVLDVFKKRLEYPDLRKMAIRLYNKSPWPVDKVICEDKGSGQSLIQDLKRNTRIPIIPIPAESDKTTRLSSVTAIMEAGKFHLPKSASWLIDYETELTDFPYAEHDDQADATSQYLRYSRKAKYVRGKNPRHWK